MSDNSYRRLITTMYFLFSIVINTRRSSQWFHEKQISHLESNYIFQISLWYQSKWTHVQPCQILPLPPLLLIQLPPPNPTQHLLHQIISKSNLPKTNTFLGKQLFYPILMATKSSIMFMAEQPLLQKQLSPSSPSTIISLGDYEINSYILACLPYEYNSLVTSVTSWLESVSLHELFGLCCNLAWL